LIIVFFEGALLIALKKSFSMHLKDKLALVTSEMNPSKFSAKELLEIQHKYNIFPLFVNIIKTNQKIKINKNNHYFIQYLKRNDKREIVLIISILSSFVE